MYSISIKIHFEEPVLLQLRNEKTNPPPKGLNFKENFGSKMIHDTPMNLP